MAVMQSRNNRTLIAATDLSAAQFKFITLDADGANLAGSAGEAVFGVCLVGAGVGKAVTVNVSGSVLVTAGGTIAKGAAVQTSATGEALAAAAGDVVAGYAREAAVDNQIIEIELIQGGNVVPA